MTLSQQKYREIVFQLLYSQDMGHPDEPDMVNLIMAELAISKKNVRLALDKVRQILQHLPEIDPLIASVSKSYEFERIQRVTKNILRLGVYELFFDDGIPPKVAIAEAIRLSRKFNTPESASFVNALLDHLYQKRLGCQSDPNLLEERLQAFTQSEQASLDFSLNPPPSEESSHADS